MLSCRLSCPLVTSELKCCGRLLMPVSGRFWGAQKCASTNVINLRTTSVFLRWQKTCPYIQWNKRNHSGRGYGTWTQDSLYIVTTRVRHGPSARTSPSFVLLDWARYIVIGPTNNDSGSRHTRRTPLLWLVWFGDQICAYISAYCGVWSFILISKSPGFSGETTRILCIPTSQQPQPLTPLIPLY